MSNLSKAVAQNANRVETSQRMRAERSQRRESGYVGNRSSNAIYPYQVSAMGAGNLVTSTSVPAAQYPAQAIAERAMGLGTANGLGQGGTAASAAGAAGGSPA